MISGKIAGETAVIALGKQDFSETALSHYQEELENSFIIKDLRTYKEVCLTVTVRLAQVISISRCVVLN